MPFDLTEALGALREGRVQATALLAESLDRADGAACEHVFLRRFDDDARAAARTADAAAARGAPLALGGLAVSVKD
ncbi:amidase, partial [Mitsuaria sp. GD03876]|nr:amidase [Mitsuaria sp. GD03876]